MGHLSQFGVVDEVGPVSVDEGAQSQAIFPTERRRRKREAHQRRRRNKEQQKRGKGKGMRVVMGVSNKNTDI